MLPLAYPLYRGLCFHCPTFHHSCLLPYRLGALRFMNFKKCVSFLLFSSSVLQNIISSCEPEGTTGARNQYLILHFPTKITLHRIIYLYIFLNLVKYVVTTFFLMKGVTQRRVSVRLLLDTASLVEGLLSHYCLCAALLQVLAVKPQTLHL